MVARKTLIFLLLAMVVLSTSAIDPKRILVNNPYHEIFRRVRSLQNVKVPFDTKGGAQMSEPTLPPVRKGEYICGNKICRLRPGEIPPDCNGVCQYRVH